MIVHKESYIVGTNKVTKKITQKSRDEYNVFQICYPATYEDIEAELSRMAYKPLKDGDKIIHGFGDEENGCFLEVTSEGSKFVMYRDGERIER